MAEKQGLYKCEICGNVVEAIDASVGELSCCRQPMKLIKEIKGVSEGKEKHIPVISVDDDSIKVVVGSTLHPMEDDHYIELVQLLVDGVVVYENRLFPGDEPVAFFKKTGLDGRVLSARAYCNVHGLWRSND